MISNYLLLGLFFITLLVILDANVGEYIILLFKILKVNFDKTLWMIRFHPAIYSSPFGKWLMMKKYMQIVKELSQEVPPEDQDSV